MSKLLSVNCLIVLFTAWLPNLQAQKIPSSRENIEYLVTFGKQAPTGWGDDDYTQILFFVVPKTHDKPFYIRVFDPDVGGNIDMNIQGFNTSTSFSIYGGETAFSDKDAQGLNPTGNYKSGILLGQKTFNSSNEFDSKWYTFGPFNPSEGEFTEQFGGNIFKVIIEGKSGNDGNLYLFYMSESATENIPLEGGNCFTYEYSFRLKTGENNIAHLYPFVDNSVVSIYQNNFDFDNDGYIKLFSVAKNGHIMDGSGDNKWAKTGSVITDEERGKSLDIQIHRKGSFNNDMVFYVTNEYNQPIPFFASPIGGPPKYNYKIDIKYH